MTDPIKAGFDIAFQDPRRAVTLTQNLVALVQSVGTATVTAKTVGVGIGSRFLDRIEAEQVQGLHGSIGQGRDAQRTKLGGVAAFRNVDPPQRLWLITMPAELVESGCFPLRSVPAVAVHSGGGGPLIGG